MMTDAQLSRREVYINRLIAESISMTVYMSSVEPGSLAHNFALARLDRIKAQLQLARRALIRETMYG